MALQLDRLFGSARQAYEQLQVWNRTRLIGHLVDFNGEPWDTFGEHGKTLVGVLAGATLNAVNRSVASVELARGVATSCASTRACARMHTSRHRRASNPIPLEHYTRAAHPRPIPQRSSAEDVGRSRHVGLTGWVGSVEVLTGVL
jgi:hypothetical protein